MKGGRCCVLGGSGSWFEEGGVLKRRRLFRRFASSGEVAQGESSPSEVVVPRRPSAQKAHLLKGAVRSGRRHVPRG